MSEQTKRDYVELTDEMLDEVAGGSIYYMADGSAVDGVALYKLEGMMKNGKLGRFYSDDIRTILEAANKTGISKDIIKIES